MWGLVPADIESDFTHEVWPDNWQAVVLFSEMGTQWRIGFSGPTGLDYGCVYARLDRLGLPQETWEQTYDDVRILESAALEQMSKDRG